MPIAKKSPQEPRLSRLDKKKLLGAFLIISFIAFGAVLVTYYLLKAGVDVKKAAIVSICVGGLLAVYIEMRGKLGERASRVKHRLKTRIKTIRKTKPKKKK